MAFLTSWVRLSSRAPGDATVRPGTGPRNRRSGERVTMTGDRQRGDDAALVREVAAGSEVALGMLYDQYVDAVYAAASRLTTDRQVAEEVVQETFLALWNGAELFDPAMGSLAAWLHAIAARPPAAPGSPHGRAPTGRRADADPGREERTNQPMMGAMEHQEVRDILADAAVEPGGLERLMAGDSPTAALVASHLAGCPE